MDVCGDHNIHASVQNISDDNVANLHRCLDGALVDLPYAIGYQMPGDGLKAPVTPAPIMIASYNILLSY
jgi:hypothetical protein